MVNRNNEEEILSDSLPEWHGQAIILVDLDAFFASVEQMDHPEWRGQPVIVGGSPDARGVVSTCSYEARKYGVRSAMPSSTAAKLCPNAIWTRGNYHRYREVSKQVMQVIRDETPFLQQVSIDEAFADISPTRTNVEHPVHVAQRIQSRVAELGVTCSIGIGATKAVAKIASDMDKPNGLTVVFPGTERGFLASLPVRTMSGIGKSAEAKLLGMGIKTLGDLSEASVDALRTVFGVQAEMMQARAMGEDASPVTQESDVKSVSHEISFAKDLTKRENIEAALNELLGKVCRRLRLKGLEGKTLTVKVRYGDRTLHTSQVALEKPSNDEIELYPKVIALVDNIWHPGISVRLLGVAISGFGTQCVGQETLFGEADPSSKHERPHALASEKVLIEDADKRRSLLNASDALKDKFGEDAIRFGSSFRNAGNTTGSGSKHPSDYK